jgi:PAS domain S-box-containing protein
MAKKPGGSTKVTALRRQAEEALRATRRDVATMPGKDVQQLVHELQVHQVELEMQNDELRRVQVELEAARDRYVDLYDGAPTGYLTLDSKGVILEANLPACTLLGINRKDLLGKPVIRFVAAKDQATCRRHIREMLNTGVRQACEVDLAPQNNTSIAVRFESLVVPDETGQHPRVRTVVLDITEHKRAEALALESQEGLLRQLILEERLRIGHDLHDGILQSLYAIGLGIEAGKLYCMEAPDKAEALLTRGIDELNSVMQEVRSFIGWLETEGLSEPALPTRDLDLSGLLHTMADTLARFHGRQVRVSVDATVATGLSHAQSLEILKLAKEALSNSLRHAQATLVQVSFLQRKGCVCLAVRDNGVGFDRNAVSGEEESGLANMAARAVSLGATLSVFSKPQQGTCLVLNLSKKNSKKDGTGQGGCPLRTHEKRACGSRRNAAANVQTEFPLDSLCACPFQGSHSTCALGEEAAGSEG